MSFASSVLLSSDALKLNARGATNSSTLLSGFQSSHHTHHTFLASLATFFRYLPLSMRWNLKR